MKDDTILNHFEKKFIKKYSFFMILDLCMWEENLLKSVMSKNVLIHSPNPKENQWKSMHITTNLKNIALT